MKMKTLFASFLLVLLVVQLAHADLEDFKNKYGETSFNVRLIGWEGVAIAAILICLSFNTLLYMMGSALESEQLKRYAKSEFLQVSASALMIFFAVELLYQMSGSSAIDLMGEVLGSASHMPCAAAPNGRFALWQDSEFGSGPLGAFKCKLQEKISSLDVAYSNIYSANQGTEEMTSTCFTMFGIPVYCGDWDFALHKEVEEAHLLANKIVGLLMPLHSLFVLATYIQNNMLSVFLPMGLVLRILPLTRGVGGLFIAIAIGFFFIWPTFFLLTDQSFVKQDEQLAPANTNQAGACYSGFKGTAVVLQQVLTGGGSGGGFALASGKQLVFDLSIAILFYPFVALAITLAFIRAATPLLGGDMGELMKMVARLG